MSNHITNPDNNAFPLSGSKIYKGLTKREWFASLALQGILQRPNTVVYDDTYKDIAKQAINMADNLIDELNDDIA